MHLTESINTTLEQDEFQNFSTIQILDILEIWSTEAGNAEFVNEINNFFADRELPWRLCSDKIVKIDAKQFEQDLTNKALAMMEEIQKAIPVFQNPYKEYLIALEKYSITDYSQAIMYANMSYESILKIILGREGTASELTCAYTSSQHVESLPKSIKKAAFNEKILSSLPFLRNKPVISHGAGTHDLEIPSSLAKLAINLAATLNTYLIEEYINHMRINEPEENTDSFSFDDVPF